MDTEERGHARALRAIAGDRGADGPFIARLEGRHRSTSGNALRAAVLGANDGLLSNLSLVMGVAGANLAPREIIITGVAGLLAGAGSMALGEWLSVQSSRELFEKQIAVEAAEISAYPEEEAEELALIYQAKGLSEEHAREVASRLMESEGSALDTLAREELGIDPQELGGSALHAAVASFVLFAIGAVIPLFRSSSCRACRRGREPDCERRRPLRNWGEHHAAHGPHRLVLRGAAGGGWVECGGADVPRRARDRCLAGPVSWVP
jgi:VIT1/CCC1 family predicted Fe2+/Mn2+ transporter